MTLPSNKLKEIRMKNDLSQLKLSQITGIAPCSISNIEKGRQYVFPGWKKRIATALCVPEDEIFPEESENLREA